jgi:type VI secretion system secreted protein VgrG
MPKYSQTNRLLSVSTPLGTDILLLQRVTGVEAVSRLFRFELEMLAESHATIPFDKILGQSVTVTLVMPAVDSKRYINGIVSRFSQGGRRPSALGGGTFTVYRAEVVPQFWTLTRNHQSRIFQQIAVPDILKQVLTGLKVSYQLQGDYKPRDYCVQYRESDFAFASRLMEEEGNFYFFTHSFGSHEMVVADTHESFADVPGPTHLIYETLEGGTRTEDRIHRWKKSQTIRSGKYRLWDSCFELPGKNLESVRPTLDAVPVGTVTHHLNVGNKDLEIYDYQGGYAQRFDGVDPGGADRSGDVQNIFADGTRTVGIRMQEEEAGAVLLEGESTCRQLVAGGKFALTRHFDGDGPYVLTRVDHVADAGDAYTLGNAEATYSNTFQCIPAALPYRPERTIPRPRIEGTQTAVVVGPPGQEVFTDKYGRVKVKFPWDRQGQHNESSSCWVRVAQLAAGRRWGMSSWPRIGQEVIVDYQEGDPDQPIIIGTVYNADQMPPYLGQGPDSQHSDENLISGFKSNTSIGGHGYNEIRFYDAKGKEQVFLHAERNMDTRVKNERMESVLGNRHSIVGTEKDKDKAGDENEEIWRDRNMHVHRNRVEHIEGNVQLLIGQGSASDGGNQDVFVEKNRTEKVGQNLHLAVDGERQEKIGTNQMLQAGNEIHMKAGMKVVIESGVTLTIKGAGGFVQIGPDGVTIQGTMVKINCGGSAESAQSASPNAPQQAKPSDPQKADDAVTGSKSCS